MKVKVNKVYKPSEDVVSREVGGEFVLIPITSGSDDPEDRIFSLNNCGLAIWKEFDGKKTIKDVVNALSSRFEGEVTVIKKDVLGISEELFKRKLIVKK